MGKRRAGTFAERVKQVRLLRGMTARGVDAAAGIAPGHTWQIEKGNRTNPEARTVMGLARALGVTVDWLLTGTGVEPAESPKAAS